MAGHKSVDDLITAMNACMIEVCGNVILLCPFIQHVCVIYIL